MTPQTPPGWYPDPGHSGEGPRGERWWDGTAWTDRTRQAAPAEPPGTAPAGIPADAPSESRDPRDPAATRDPATPLDTSAPQDASAPQDPASAQAPTAQAASAQAPSAPGPSAPQSPYGPQPPYPPAAPYGASGPYGAPQPGVPGPYGGYGPYGMPPAPRRGRGRWIAGISVGVVLLAVLGVGSWALVAGDDADAKSPAASAPREPGAPGGGKPSTPPRQRGEGGGGDEGRGGGSGTVRSGTVPDLVNGLRIPVPKGWEGQSLTTGASVNAGSYACPVPDPSAGDEDSCVHGGVQSVPAVALGITAKTAEEIAKADIAKNAEDSYGGGAYGDITSHSVDAAKPVRIAGSEGYLVRWKVVTSKGPDGYAESVAFPSPTTKQMVVLRVGLDISDDAPKLSVLDGLLDGIKAGEAGTAGGGTGENA
ncbi:DUF2510 domain-containing protein [Streptomyces sp. NPDC006684]|uniref:DUF2510 domain-containing protein n=1 Tax=Streptomyces sp. NPDC006684 TaxID=3154477 RepID=UPI0034529E99